MVRSGPSALSRWWPRPGEMQNCPLLPGWSGLGGVCVLPVWNRAMGVVCLGHSVLTLPGIALARVSIGIMLYTRVE